MSATWYNWPNEMWPSGASTPSAVTQRRCSPMSEEHYTCTRCGESKPATDYYYGARDGRLGQCKTCKRTASNAYRAANLGRVRESNRNISESQRAKRAERARLWRVANPERSRALIAEWEKANADHVAAKKAAWVAANPERSHAIKTAWKARNPDAVRDARELYRSRKHAAADIEPVSRLIVWQRDDGRCHICGRRADINDWHLEHIVPLSRGGGHSYKNVAVSHPSCNLSKGSRVLGTNKSES